MKNIPHARSEAEAIWQTVLGNTLVDEDTAAAFQALKPEVYRAMWRSAFTAGFVQGALWEQRLAQHGRGSL